MVEKRVVGEAVSPQMAQANDLAQGAGVCGPIGGKEQFCAPPAPSTTPRPEKAPFPDGSGGATERDIVPASEASAFGASTIRIVVYSSDEAVPSQRFVAYVVVPTKAPKTGVISERRLGISFPAADYDAARSAAEAWWNGELSRERAKEAAAIKRGEALSRARDAALSKATGGQHV